ncbi:MAG TPA: TIGR00282 family metallophosphoesterase [Alphaproteobacteria bacterium]|nr:TIGR00282 family metallophosphoesterase [Alphaproteobacteria bacterium]
MRILFIGDIMGRTGRDALEKHLPTLKEKLKPDVIIVNGENAAHGLGITEQICKDFYGFGVDVITTGNHVWDQREILSYIERDPKLLRPINFPANTPGNGHVVHELKDGRKIMVINAMARLFMDPMEDPFKMVMDLVQQHKMGHQCDAIFLDFHGEATSEKMAIAHYLDGKVSGVVGTHTHIPTADAQILPSGTAFQTDAGMTGDYDSVIGVRKEISIHRFVRKIPGERMIPADGEPTLCGTLIVTSDNTGLAKNVAPVRIGGRLHEEIPAF